MDVLITVRRAMLLWITLQETKRTQRYYIKSQQDATLAVLFNSICKITLHVSDAFCVHHQEY